MRNLPGILFVLLCGLVPAIICQFFVKSHVDRYIHVTSFRYGKEPSVIRCNRGDRLHLTFSTNDTGHSFFLEEFDMDAKVSPSRNEVEVFKPSDPTEKSVRTREVTFTALHPGLSKLPCCQKYIPVPCLVWSDACIRTGEAGHFSKYLIDIQFGKCDRYPGILDSRIIQEGLKSGKTEQDTKIC